MQRPCGRSRQGAHLGHGLAEVLRPSVDHREASYAFEKGVLEAEAGGSPIQVQLLSKPLSKKPCTWTAQLTELEGGQPGQE